MTPTQPKISRFSVYIGLILTILVALAAIFALHVHTEQQIAKANDLRHRSMVLAAELRQTSSDLTRMARTFVVTRDPVYKQYFQEILDIRDGRKARPQDYHVGYWDEHLDNQQQNPGAEPAVPLLGLMRQAGFTEQELAKLAQIKKQADGMLHIERSAMDLSESKNSDGNIDRSAAIRMLHDNTYHGAIATITRTIHEFEIMVDQRTLALVQRMEQQSSLLRVLLIVLGVLQAFLLWQTRQHLHAMLGCSVPVLFQSIARLGAGDFSTRLEAPKGNENSVLVWLAETQTKLSKLELHQFKAIVDSNEDAIISTSLEGVIKSWNPGAQHIFGYTAKEAIGQRMHMLLPPGTASTQAPVMAKIAQGEPVVRLERPYVRQDGRLIYGATTVSPIKDEQGQVVGVCAIARDITERKRREEELTEAREMAEAASRSKDQFLTTMSHELRTPMNAILGFGQMLQIDSDLNEDQQDSVHEILKAGRHLLHLINDVLDLAKISADQLEISLEPVDLDDVLKECESLIRPLAQQRQISLSLPAQGLLMVTADRVRLKQVLLNLLSNAVKYNRDGGRIEVQTETASDNRLRIKVIDTGHGIAPEQLPHLFEPFNRLGAEASGIEGTGVGLSITRKLVEKMDGLAGATSELGVGSRFWVDLPLAETRGAVASDTVRPAEDAQAPQAHYRLLCIDDNPVNLKLMSRMLGRKGCYKLENAHTPELGIELALNNPPDLVLLDINMPGMDGYKVLKVFQSSPQMLGIPVVAVTANAMPRDIERGLRAGFTAYVSKPITDVEVFLRTVQDSLSSANPLAAGCTE